MVCYWCMRSSSKSHLSPLDLSSLSSLWQVGLTWSLSLISLMLVISQHRNEASLLGPRGGEDAETADTALHTLLSNHLLWLTHFAKCSKPPASIQHEDIIWGFPHSFWWSQVHFSHSQQNHNFLFKNVFLSGWKLHNIKHIVVTLFNWTLQWH